MRELEINRKKYEKIRKMDHNTLRQYVNGVFKQGYTEGSSQSKALTADEIKTAVLSIKGIGDAKADSIVSAIVEAEKEKKGSR